MADASNALIAVEPDTETLNWNVSHDESSFIGDDKISLSIDAVANDEGVIRSSAEDCLDGENQLSQITSQITSDLQPTQLDSKPKTSGIESGDIYDTWEGKKNSRNDSPSAASICTNKIKTDCEDSESSICNSSLSSSPSTITPPRATESESNGKEKRDSDGRIVNDASSDPSSSENNRSSGVWKGIVDDFDSSRGGDHKILRAIGRTATVNAVVTATAALGPIAAVAGYATGGAITAKRLVGDGIAKDNPKEVAKSVAVFGSATSASLAGQAITGVVAVGILGVGLPLAGALAFGAGCVSGITAGALSEWGVDVVMKKGGSEEDESKDSAKEVPAEATAKGIEEIPTTEKQKTRAKSKLIDACGSWVNRQREKYRQRKLQREKTRMTFAIAAVKQHEEKSPNAFRHSMESTETASTVNTLSEDDSLDLGQEQTEYVTQHTSILV